VPGVSVIIPTFNRKLLLEETLGSVYAQDPAPSEIIVVDDGSSDGTAEVVRALHPDVRYIWQPNQNQAVARETGRLAARKELLLFLDSDDLLLGGAIGLLLDALNSQPGCPVAFGKVVGFCGGDIAPLPVLNEPKPGEETVHLACENFIRSPGCALIRKSAMDRAGSWDATLAGNEDWDMWIRLSLVGAFARVDRPVLNYRVHAQSVSSNTAAMRRSAARLIMKHSGKGSMLRSNPHSWENIRDMRRRFLPTYLYNALAGREETSWLGCIRLGSEFFWNRIAEGRSPIDPRALLRIMHTS
jgi:glycosyltransferase involved in cell wall biosynthesis